MIRVILPQHLRTLAHVGSEVQLELDGELTLRSVLDALEARFPMLRGTIRDQVTQQRRPFLRFFACEEDLSHEPPDAPLPDAVASGKEPFIIIGAIAGLMAFEMSMFAWELARERTRRKQPEWPETQAARDLMRLEFLPKPMPAACDERSEGFQKY